MVILGILLILLGALVIVAALFGTEGTEFLGFETSLLAMFFIGVAAGALVLWGLGILRWGTRRGLARRKERKELSKLNEKLDRVEAEQHRDRDERP